MENLASQQHQRQSAWRWCLADVPALEVHLKGWIEDWVPWDLTDCNLLDKIEILAQHTDSGGFHRVTRCRFTTDALMGDHADWIPLVAPQDRRGNNDTLKAATMLAWAVGFGCR